MIPSIQRSISRSPGATRARTRSLSTLTPVPGTVSTPASRSAASAPSSPRPPRSARSQHVLRAVRVQMDARRRGLDRAGDVEVARGVFVGGDQALHAEFGRTEVPGVGGDRADVVERECAGLAGRRGAESARGEVAVHDQAHGLADRVAAHVVGGRRERVEVVARRLEQRDPLGVVERERVGRGRSASRRIVRLRRADPLRQPLPSRVGACGSRRERGGDLRAGGCGEPGRRVGERRDRGRAAPGRSRSRHRWTNSGCAVSRSRSSKPSSAVRAARSSGAATAARGSRGRRSAARRRPSRRRRRARSSSNSAGSERFGGTCTRMRGPITSRATATAATYSSSAASGASCIAVRGFARKFWTMTSCTWPCRSCASRSAMSDSARSRRVSPMPTRMPVVNGTRSRPASSITREAQVGILVGRAVVHLTRLLEQRAARSSRASSPSTGRWGAASAVRPRVMTPGSGARAVRSRR